MPEPQPGTGPAGETRPTGPPATAAGPTGHIPAQRGAANDPESAPDKSTGAAPKPDEPTDAAPHSDEPTNGGPDPDEPTNGTPEPDEPTTDAVAPRWSGSAPVPPSKPGRRKRRWLGTEEYDESPTPVDQPRRDPTLELPMEERESLESRAPVDPWADADQPWDGHLESWAEKPEDWQPPAGPHHPPPPATRPYPVSPPAQHRSPASGTGPYPGSPAPARRGPTARPPAPPVGPPPGRPHRSAPPALPAPRGPSAPERKKPKRSGGRRPAEYEPQQPPPGWRAPRGYIPVAVRRRRRWPGFMTTFTLLTIACCCGIPAYFGKPMWEQYPASASLPTQIADLSLRDDARSKRTAERLELDMRTAHAFAEGTFAGVYSDPSDKRVIVFGATGFRFSPDKDLDAEVGRLTEPYRLTNPRSIDTGVRGEYLRCGTGQAESIAVVLCTWADHGSLATALFDRRSVADSAQLVGALRENIVKRG